MKKMGIDVGGTNTDAVVIENGKVLHSIKTLTTKDVVSGVTNALQDVIKQTKNNGKDIEAVMIGTTHFVNAVIQRKELAKVATLRISAPAAMDLYPACDWPKDLSKLVDGGYYIVEGGFEFDGREIVPFNEKQVLEAIAKIKENNVKCIAISSTFSTIRNDHELRVKELVLKEIPDALVTISSEFGKIGLLERENVTILNSSLLPLAHKTITSFQKALDEVKLNAPLYITQNDGTITSANNAKLRPVSSFASGPTNSMRGAVMLSGIKNGVVCDVGGTTTDFGFVVKGFPREANNVIEVGGVRTLFRMPDLFSIGLGGGSIVSDQAKVGPNSVALELFKKAKSLGGDILTATDIMVYEDLLDIGDKDKLKNLNQKFVDNVLVTIKEMVEESIDHIKLSAKPVPLIAVGGGACLVPDKIEGISEVIRVKNAGVANAVGAAMAQVSGYTDKVLSNMSRDEAIAKATEFAKKDAISKGANEASLEVVEVEDTPMAYMQGNNLQVKVKVIGDIK